MSSSAMPYAGQSVRTERSRPGVSWTLWAGAVAITSSMIGGIWDVSWHRSIGRDSFLTPAHVAIYACGVIAAVVCGWLILSTTFGSAERRAQSVEVLGFRAPVGAFIAAWGGIAMLTSAPFDNWWHAAYGLDVKIISPPHTLLLIGVRAVSIGVMFLILAAMNRARDVPGEAATFSTPRVLFLYLGGLVVAGQMFFLIEATWDVKLHGVGAYIAVGAMVPIAMAAVARASGFRWAATTTAAIYMAFSIGEILILPLVPASPRLGPVYHAVTHLVPAKFPLLLIVPALAMDLLWTRLRAWKIWQVALLSGVVFTAVLVAVEWPFASFLMSKASENRFFGTIYFDYSSRASGFDQMRQFVFPSSGAQLWGGLVIAFGVCDGVYLAGAAGGSADARGAAMKAIAYALGLLLVLLVGTSPAHAHVGSKDVFETVHAGPYTLYVTIRPPDVIPGVATVEVRSSGAAVSALSITPLPVTGEAAKHPPAADAMTASSADPAFFTGAVWMMSAGTWQVRFAVDGAAGPAVASVPVLAVPVATLKMERGLGSVLAVLGLFLLVSLAAIVRASVTESGLRAGEVVTPGLRRRGWTAGAVTLAVLAAVVWLGGRWWHVEAAGYAANIYKAPVTTAKLTGDQLDLLVASVGADHDARFNAGSAQRRGNADYLPDHGKLMHLYAIRWPEMDAAYHLHPQLAAPGDFRLELPRMTAGHYRLFGDVVHANGFPETLTAEVDLPAGLAGTALSSEDAQAQPAAISAGELGTAYKLPDGYTMVWDKPQSLTARMAYGFRFHLLAPDGSAAKEMQPYLGMAGHAAFVKADGTVFAHTHPDGSAAMADVMLADASMGQGAVMEMPAVGPEVSFPYGFPSAGRYRIFVQMKHRGVVETGVFDAEVK